MHKWIGKTLFLSCVRAVFRKQLSGKPSVSLKGGFRLFILENILMSVGAMARLYVACMPR